MRLLRPITLLVLFLSLFTLGFPSAWASENLTNDDDWWEKQYEKFDDTDQCSAFTDYLKGLRFYDHHNTTFLAHIFLGGYLRQGTCLKVNIPLAKKVFIFAAERGETTPALLLAQLYFTEEGEEGSNAQEWAKRARLLMITLTTPMRWKQYLFKRFQTSTLSPHLEHAFAWIKEKQNGPVDAVYDIGMDVLKNGTYPESKVVACRWFYNAEIKGHTKASFQLGRQLALGDGVPDSGGGSLVYRARELVENAELHECLLLGQTGLDHHGPMGNSPAILIQTSGFGVGLRSGVVWSGVFVATFPPSS